MIWTCHIGRELGAQAHSQYHIEITKLCVAVTTYFKWHQLFEHAIENPNIHLDRYFHKSHIGILILHFMLAWPCELCNTTILTGHKLLM